jgi:squalene-hopene/tetraprenyl-beta-curcumene cyclase
MISGKQLQSALRTVTAQLLAERSEKGMWIGELSSSALSTATAVIALSHLSDASRQPEDPGLARAGLDWLAKNQNLDGGWGDTVLSLSNISTTALCWSAFNAAGLDGEFLSTVQKAGNWLFAASGAVEPEGWLRKLADAIRRRYGKDRTFSVPILMTCALCGRLGPEGWKEVPALPFELSVLPQRLFGLLQLPVVSYALPALIAIGRVIHHFAPTANPLVRAIRNAAGLRASRVLEQLQPVNGGFLEATPLTSFVLMSLAAMGEDRCLVARRAADFLRKSVRGDGSWPIDTNLSTWVSTWAVSALSHQREVLRVEERSVLRDWLLGQQFRERHPYTQAAPGGWAWTDLPGGVPDADDTPGALLALGALGVCTPRELEAAERGVRWLLDLQNKDGGMPTFCKGWGALPFDRSGCDLTAHALRAWSFWLPHVCASLHQPVRAAIERGLAYLRAQQKTDGTWVPLWFGNQHAVDDENPVYGTARVVVALRELQERGFDVAAEMLRPSEAALVRMQLEDGGWGGGPPSPGRVMRATVEETGLCLEALAGSRHVGALEKGVEWMLEKVASGGWTKASPIGFYFAKLWYFERLYPVVAAVGGLGAVARYEALLERDPPQGGVPCG